MTRERHPERTSLVGGRVTALSFQEHVDLLALWARARESRVVCVANVHMMVEAARDSEFAGVVDRADVVSPDGMPLVWLMRQSGVPAQERVAGMDLLPALCARAAGDGTPVFFLGSTPGILEAIRRRLERELPAVKIAGMESPPFRPLTREEDAKLTQRIVASGAAFVFVSLGCPRQERWMDVHRHQIGAVMVGLGAAFAVYAGIEPRAPRWMQRAGLEWLYRLRREPHRLWRRYLFTNVSFAWYLIAQWLRSVAR